MNQLSLRLLNISPSLLSVVLVFSFSVFSIVESSNGLTKNFLTTSSLAHLGGEYDAIARAIYAGKGFANPFEIETGPTAWMPPVAPYSLACGYWLLGRRDRVVFAVLIIKSIVLFDSCMIALSEASRRRLVWVGALVVFLFLVADNYHLFLHTGDTWVVLAIVNVMWRIQTSIAVSWIAAATNGMVGGLAALTSPILGGAWFALVASSFRSHTWLKATLTLLVATMLVIPWVVRNKLVLNKAYPIKSNLAFELWQSQCLDNDGVLDRTTLMSHPFVPESKQRKEYAAKGEVCFMNNRMDAFLASVSANPLQYLDRVSERLKAACLWRPESQLSFLSLLSFVCAFILLLSNERMPFLCAVLYFSYLTPYIAVSYYDRYGAPLFSVKALLVIFTLSRLSCIASSGILSGAECRKQI